MGFLLREDASSTDKEHPVITFLYKLAAGVEPRSYGLNVARLAQLPAPLLAIAQQKSSQLEKEVWNRTLASAVRSLHDATEASDTESIGSELHLQIRSAFAARRE